jgi:hypothetical protein
MGITHSTHGLEAVFMGFLMEIQNEIDHWEDVDADEEIISG